MACACSKKKSTVAKATPQRTSRPINNGGILSRRIEKRIIR